MWGAVPEDTSVIHATSSNQIPTISINYRFVINYAIWGIAWRTAGQHTRGVRCRPNFRGGRGWPRGQELHTSLQMLVMFTQHHNLWPLLLRVLLSHKPPLHILGPDIGFDFLPVPNTFIILFIFTYTAFNLHYIIYFANKRLLFNTLILC